VAHFLPPGLAQSDRTCPFLLLVRFCYLSVFSTSKLVRSGRFAHRPPRALGPLGPLDPSRAGVFAERRILFDFAHSGRDTFSLSRHCRVGPAFSSIPFLPRRPTVATHRLRPPRAARPLTSRCQARSSLHALISPLISLLNPSSSHPAINGVKAITSGCFPLPGVPFPGHYKRMRSTPRPSPHSPRPQSLASESVAPTSPSASSADRSSPSPGRIRPSAAPSCIR
jgi:hypothetical protein